MPKRKLYFLKDVAELFGLSEGAVRMRLHRGDDVRGHFPPPFRLGGAGCKLVWIQENVDEFLLQKSKETLVKRLRQEERDKVQFPPSDRQPPRPRGRPKKAATVLARRS